MKRILLTLILGLGYFYNLYSRGIFQEGKISWMIFCLGLMFILTFLLANHFNKGFTEFSHAGFLLAAGIVFVSINSFDFVTFSFFRNYILKLICIVFVGGLLETAGFILLKKIFRSSAEGNGYFPGMGFGTSLLILLIFSTVFSYAGVFHLSKIVPVFLCLLGFVYNCIFIRSGLWTPEKLKKICHEYLPFLLILIPYLLYMFSSLAAPPHRMDELLYTLPCAEAIVDNNGFAEVKNIPWSNFPGNHFLLFALSKILIPFCGRALYLLFPMFTLLVLISLFPGSRTSVYIVCSIWILTVSGCHAGSEWILVFFELLALRVFCRACESQETGSAFLVLSGLFAGLALGTKYTAFLLVIFISCYLVISCRSFKRFLLFFLPLLIISGHWYYKSYLLCGNPFYPLFYEYLPSSFDYLDSAAEIQDSYLKFNGISGFWQRFSVPYYLLKYDFSSFFQDGLLGFLFIPTFMFIDYKKVWNNKTCRIFFLFSLWYIFSWVFFMPQVIRFAFFPLLIIPFLPRIHSVFFKYVVLVTFITGPVIMLLGPDFTNPCLEMYAGKTGETGFVRRMIPEYPAIEFCNARIDKNNQVLCLFDSRIQYFEKQRFVHTDYNSQAGYSIRKAEPEMIPDLLRKFNIRYIFINLRRAEKTFLVPWVQPTVLTDTKFLAIFASKVFYANGVLIYKMK